MNFAGCLLGAPPPSHLTTPSLHPFPLTPLPGLDSADIVSRLRAAHAADPQGARTGVDILTGGLGDMRDRGIFEAFKVKNSVLMSATEAAEMILRVDDIIKAAPRQRQ